MKTKEKILELLKKNIGEYFSGQEIADEIYVTRAAVWKGIKTLQNEGYRIDAVTNKGYRLRQTPDVIDEAYICNRLREAGVDIEVIHKEEVTSTNDVARQYAIDRSREALIIANSQSNGRGRRGRNFYSPENTGIYMSILLYPEGKIEQSMALTAIAATATARAIDNAISSSGRSTSIKWVNDIFVDGYKVAGILTEAFSSLEDPNDSYIIIGIGINVYEPESDFPKELKKIAGSVLRGQQGQENIRNNIISDIVKYLDYYIKGDETRDQECLDIYREKSFLIGSYVRINSFNDNHSYGRVLGVDEDYHLVVQSDDDVVSNLSSGEVSVVKY